MQAEGAQAPIADGLVKIGHEAFADNFAGNHIGHAGAVACNELIHKVELEDVVAADVRSEQREQRVIEKRIAESFWLAVQRKDLMEGAVANEVAIDTILVERVQRIRSIPCPEICLIRKGIEFPLDSLCVPVQVLEHVEIAGLGDTAHPLIELDLDSIFYAVPEAAALQEGSRT